MNKRFRLAVVGCGDIAAYVALVTKTLPRFSISACVSKQRSEAEQFAKKYRIPYIFTDLNELLEHRDLYDAVYLSTPHNLHSGMIKSAIDLNIPVLCEKPIAESLSSAEHIVNYVNHSKVKVGINYQYRYNPACQKLIHFTRQDIGKLYYIRVNIPWHRKSDYFDHSSWHKKLTTAGGGTLLTQGSHFLDIALLAANSVPIKTFGITDQKFFNRDDIEIEDFSHAIITMKNGSHIEITSSMISNPEQTATIEVYGEKGFAKFSAEKHPNFSVKGTSASQFDLHLPFGVHPLARSLQGFKEWIMDKSPYLTPISSALPVMTAIDAIYRSAKTHQEEPVE